MATVTESVDVHVPLHTAYNQWTQFEEFPRFMEGVEEVHQMDPTHAHWKTRIGGVEREFDSEIFEQQPDERVAWRSTTGPDQVGVVTFQPITEADTRVTMQLEWTPEGFAEKAGDLMRLDDRRVHNDLERFKEFIEARGTETGAWRGEV